jgi:hypothetical protein
MARAEAVQDERFSKLSLRSLLATFSPAARARAPLLTM